MVSAASICAIGTNRTFSATINTIWKNVPIKMMEILALSPMPSHSMTKGMKATAGMYRMKSVSGSSKASTGRKAPISTPIGRASTADKTKPASTRKMLMEASCSKSSSSSQVDGDAR